MAMDTPNQFDRAEDDAANRCQQVTSRGQCTLIAIPGSKFCTAHGGHAVITKEKKEAVRNYRLTQWKARVADFASNSEVKSVREEIGILRMLLEERLNACTTSTELILHSQAISDLVGKIEHVVTSCHRLESSMGQLLDKQAIIKFAGELVTIITAVIDDLLATALINEEAASILSGRIADALVSTMQDTTN